MEKVTISGQEIGARDYKKLERCLGNRNWRLDNLYYIIDEHGKRVKFKMRAAQRKLLRDMHWRNVILKARQMGFTTFIDIFGLDLVVFNKNISAGIIAHTRDDAQMIFRDKVKYPYDNLPDFLKKIRPAVKNDAGELRLRGNSGMRVGTSMRSGTMQFLHISEYGPLCARYPKRAQEVKTGSIPAVHAGSFLFIESTARGNEGEFYEIAQKSRHDTERYGRAGGRMGDLSFRFHFFPWYEHPSYQLSVLDKEDVIPERIERYCNELEHKLGIEISIEQRNWYTATEDIYGEEMKREYPSTPDEAFESSIEGAYYSRQIDMVYGDGRLCEVKVRGDTEVHTAWDIGYNDATSIWFYQVYGGGVHIVDYYESNNEGLGYYIEVMKEKGYRYGRHFGPHDLGVHEWTGGRTRIEIALQDHGLKFELVPKVGLMDGIEVARRALGVMRFDKGRTEIDNGSGNKVGFKSLENYRKEWDSNKGTWKNMPRHDMYSHGADAFRYLCLSLPMLGVSIDAGEYKIRRMTERKNWGY